jgi:broad specificity phosphatase PhoE
MTIGMTAALLATLMAGVTLVTLGLWRMRQREETEAAGDAADADFSAEAEAALVSAPEVAAAVAARMEGLIAEQTRRQADVLTVALAGLKADIQHLKSDVEWLAGERMIEQAIQMAQTGLQPDDIGRELGMTRETAETIAAFRKH